MYVIHLIVLLNILGVMIDNKRFVYLKMQLFNKSSLLATNVMRISHNIPVNHRKPNLNSVRLCLFNAHQNYKDIELLHTV